jgi:uncharacterized Fe-S cluster protein YjdI
MNDQQQKSVWYAAIINADMPPAANTRHYEVAIRRRSIQAIRNDAATWRGHKSPYFVIDNWDIEEIEDIMLKSPHGNHEFAAKIYKLESKS